MFESKKGGYLEGHLLVATPQIQTSCFSKSVIYVCAHNEDGAMGLIINQPIELDINAADIFAECEIEIEDQEQLPKLQFGGPVEANRGFILHEGEYEHPLSASVGFLKLSSDLDILKDIGRGNGPESCMLMLGYAGWGAGQLEEEIESNSWLSLEASEDIVFKLPNEDKWEHTFSLINVDPSLLSDEVGHA